MLRRCARPSRRATPRRTPRLSLIHIFSAAQLDRLCGKLEREFDLSALREYTVEAGRPDTITAEKLRTLRAHGVDRLSAVSYTHLDVYKRQPTDQVPTRPLIS